MAYESMKKQNFGIEIELTGITRGEAAEVIAKYFGTRSAYVGGSYDPYTAADRKGCVWRAMTDGSINTKRKYNGVLINANRDYSCEVVSPILQYEDMEDLQEIVRLLRKAGAIANSSCGIHVHVDGKDHTPESLIRLMGFAIGRQDLFYEALGIGNRADHWCKKMNRDLLKAMQKDAERTRDSLERIWYSAANDGYMGGITHEHYNPSRYHGINLHAFFTKGSVEFRLFNGTTHAGKIKAYIPFCLAMSAWAIECPNERLFFKDCKDYTSEQKYTLMTSVLKNRLGLRGKEFKTCRQHLTAAFNPTIEAVAA